MPLRDGWHQKASRWPLVSCSLRILLLLKQPDDSEPVLSGRSIELQSLTGRKTRHPHSIEFHLERNAGQIA